MSKIEKNIEELTTSNQLFKAIRGEVFVFQTPPEINAEMLPTDHNELLAKAVYPLCNKLGVKKVQLYLENALKTASSDALGIFCSIQCYYIQIISERENEAPFEIDREELPQYLGKQFKKFKEDLISIKLNSYDPPDAALRLTMAAISSLKSMAHIDFGVPCGAF